MLVPSPLCHPKFKPVETAEYTKTLAQLYFFDSEALHLVFDSTSGFKDIIKALPQQRQLAVVNDSPKKNHTEISHKTYLRWKRRHELHKHELDNVVAVTKAQPSLRQTRTQAEGETTITPWEYPLWDSFLSYFSSTCESEQMLKR
ncbi:hypothetical protein JHK82_027619 [Glycine max]|nr:hypothetical protein JHK82_027619 [Glycine max]